MDQIIPVARRIRQGILPRAGIFVTLMLLLTFRSQAQVNIQLTVYQVSTNIPDCDGFLTGNSDPIWWWTGPGIVDDQCYTTTCNGCTRSVTEVLINETYNCITDVPGSASIRFRGCEDDGAGCAGGTSLAICDGSAGDITSNVPLPTATGTTFIGPICVNSTGCAGQFCYWARWDVTGSYITPPTNDNICNATPLALNTTITGNNTCATVQSGEVNSSNGSISPSNSVWYTFTAPSSGNVTVSTNFGGTNFDTEIAIYRDNGSTCPGNNWGNLTEVGNNDDIVLLFDLDSEVDLECLTPGTTYYIQVDGNSASDFGNFQLRVSPQGQPLPTNDDICSPINLGTLTFNGSIGANNFSNICATTQPGEPNPGAFATDQTVWFTFTTGANVGTEVTLDATNDPLNLGDQIDLQLALYEPSNGLCTGTMNEVDSDYFTPPFAESMTVNCLQPNTTYWVQVDGSGLNTEGYFGLTISDNGIPRGTNDDICNAINLGTIALGQSQTNNNMNNFCATIQTGEPNYPGCLSGIDQTIWVQFTTGNSLGYEMTFSAVSDPNNNGDNLDLQVGVYASSNGLCTGSLTEIDCDYDPDVPGFWTGEDLVIKCLEPNTTYFVQLDGSTINVEGYIGLTITDDGIARAPNDLVCGPTALGTIPNSGQITLNNENNYCGGVEPGEADPLNHNLDETVWYTFTPPSSGSVEIEVINTGSDDIDLQLAVWEVDTDTCTGFFAELESYDDPFSFSVDGAQAMRLKCLDTTKTYFIQVDGFFVPLLDLHVGTFDLVVRDYNVTAAPNDSICDAIPLGDATSGPITTTIQTNFCANNILEPIPTCFGTNMTVWYEFTAPATGRVIFDVVSDPNNVGDYIDLQLAVFATDGDSCAGAISEVQCDYNSGEIPLFETRDEDAVVRCLEPGRTYWLMVDGSDDPDDLDGFFQITMTMEPGPGIITNDSICNATPLGAVPASGSVTTGLTHNFCATTEAGEPVPNAFGIDATVWFTFEAPPSGNVFLDLNSDPTNLGNDIDLQVAVYESSNGTCTGTLGEVDSDWTPIFLDEDLSVTCLTPGETYWVQVDGVPFPPQPLFNLDSLEGFFEMIISEDPAFVPMPTNDSICNAVNLGTVPTGLATPTYFGSNFCATTESGEPNVDNCSFFFQAPCDETVWFTFTTNANPGTITIDVDNLTGLVPIINVYEPIGFPTCNFSDLAFIVDRTAVPLFNLSLDIPCLKPNTTYYIQLDGVDVIGDFGTFDIRVTDDATPQTIPGNDSICNATNLGLIPLGGASAVTPGSNICATEEITEPNTSQLLDRTDVLYDETVWYSFSTPATPGEITIDITNVQGGLAPAITIYRADAPPSCQFSDLTEFDNATSILAGTNLSATLPCVEPNTTYYIQVDGVDVLGDDGTFDIQVSSGATPINYPANDDICNAQGLGTVPVGGATALTPGSNICATTESGELLVSTCNVLSDPLCDETVWYTFTTPATPGITTVAVNNTVGIDANINIYRALNPPSCLFSDLDLVESADDLFSTDVSVDLNCLPPNTTYYVQVDGLDLLGDQGSFDIRVSDDGSTNSYPVNDSICNAVSLGTVPSGGTTATVPGNNFCATTEPGEPNADACPTISSPTCDETVWYVFNTGASPGLTTVDVFNTVGIDVNIDVYRVNPASSCNFSDLIAIASADNPFSTDVSLDLPCLLPNTTYYIQIDGLDLLGDNGSFDIRLSDNGTPVGAPANDLLCNAVFLGNPNGGSVGPTAGTNDCATEEPNEPNVNGDDETVWYTFIAPNSGSAQISINSISGIDANFTLYHRDGLCDFDSLTQVGNNHDDLISFDVSFTEDCLIPQDTYYIQIDGGDIFGDYGDFTVTVTDDNPSYSGPANDPCTGAIPLPIGSQPCQGSGNWNVFNYGNPTVSLNNAFTQSCGDNCGDVWFCFTMPPSGTVLLEGNDEYGFLNFNNSQLTVAAYTGPCSNLQPIQCDQGGLFDDPQYYIQGTPGDKIYLQVFDDGGNDLNENFGLCLTDRCGADSCQNATPMQPSIWYCWDTDGSTGETTADPGYLECGDGSLPGRSVYFSYVNDCESFTFTVNGTIGGLCVLGEPTDGLSIAIYQDDSASLCDFAPINLIDCEQTDACLGTSYFFQRTYSAPVGTQFIIQFDGFDFTGDNNGQVRIDENCPLDVDYQQFAGYRDEDVHQLEWTVTESEVVSGYFEVEKSLDAEDFTTLGRVNGRSYLSGGGSSGQGGSASEAYDYAYTDEVPVPGHNYYRLRYVDQNGLESFSEVIDLFWDETPAVQIVALFPNPARESIRLSAFAAREGNYEVRMVDIYGKVVRRLDIEMNEGMNLERFDLQGLSAGMYIFELHDVRAARKDHQKFIKQ
ncbi:MAG: T9SS type A sorting domain-containing protein [Bacteroidota bacterium]